MKEGIDLDQVSDQLYWLDTSDRSNPQCVPLLPHVLCCFSHDVHAASRAFASLAQGMPALEVQRSPWRLAATHDRRLLPDRRDGFTGLRALACARALLDACGLAGRYRPFGAAEYAKLATGRAKL